MFGLNFNNPQSVFYEGYRRQLLATLTVDIIAFSHGITLGWVAPMLYKLQSNNSPLEFDLSVEEVSWIGSLLSIGGLTGNAIFGCLLDRIGRKLCLYLLALPQICLWITVFFASEVYHLYMARIFGGITGGAVFLLIPIFVSEIADSKVRGTLGSTFCLSINVGILAGFIISSHIPYLLIPCIVAVLPIVYLALWTQFPETPQHLLRKGQTDAAENSLKFYKNHKCTSKDNFQKFTSDFTELKMSIQTTKGERKVSIRDFCTKRSLKAFGSGVVLIFVNMFSGAFPIINYSSNIFAETGSAMDPNTNTIIIGAVQIVGSYCATILVDKYGRKILMLLSTSGMCFGLTVIGVYAHLVKFNDLSNVTWLPVVIMSFVIFAANIGVIAVTFVLIVEILPPKIRSLGSTFCMTLLSIFAFIILKVFPILMVIIGVSGVMWICAAVSGFGFFFVLICISETKGKCLDNDSAYD